MVSSLTTFNLPFDVYCCFQGPESMCLCWVWLRGLEAGFGSGLLALALVSSEKPQWERVPLLLGAFLSSTIPVSLCLRYFLGVCLILTLIRRVDLSCWLDLKPVSPQSPFSQFIYFFLSLDRVNYCSPSFWAPCPHILERSGWSGFNQSRSRHIIYYKF